jgi:hypothetical protein
LTLRTSGFSSDIGFLASRGSTQGSKRLSQIGGRQLRLLLRMRDYAVRTHPEYNRAAQAGSVTREQPAAGLRRLHRYARLEADEQLSATLGHSRWPGRPSRIELSVKPSLPSPQDVGSILLAGVRRLLMAWRAADRAVTDNLALVRECAPQFFDRDVGRRLQRGKDHVLVGIDPARFAVPAGRSRPSPAPLAFERPPPAHARCAHAESFTGLAMAQTPRNRRKDANAMIQ